MKVSILGAAGAIGRSTAEALTARGEQVRLVGRSAEKLAALGFPEAERVSADVESYEGCVRALQGADAAVYTLGLPYTKADFSRYPVMMKTFLEAARATGLRKAILITNVYPYGVPKASRVAEDHPRVPASVKGEWRKQQEDLLLAGHDPHGLHTLSLRLPNFYGPDATLSLVDGVFRAAVRGKTADLFAPVDLPQELVFTPDVGPVVAELLTRDEAFGRPYNLAGAGTTTWREFTASVYAAARQPLKFRAVGPRMVKALGLVWPLMRELSELSHLQTHPTLLDDSRLRALLPGLRKTPYAAGIHQTAAAYSRVAKTPVPPRGAPRKLPQSSSIRASA